MQKRLLILLALLSSALALSSAAWSGEYRLEPGDTIEFSVAGIPDLTKRAMLDLDGNVTLPLVGSLTAAGLLIGELRQNIKEGMQSKAFRQRTMDGREVLIVFNPDEIMVSMVEYRPIYLKGDIAKPGQYPYRPGLTVRQAVALAGGYDVLNARSTDPVLEAADLRSEYDTLSMEYARTQVRLEAIRLELGQRVRSASKEPSEALVSREALSDLVRSEEEQLNLRNENHRKQTEYIKRVIDDTQQHIDWLGKQGSSLDQQLQIQSQELEKVRKLNTGGIAVSSRVLEEQRFTSLLADRTLQNAVQLTLARKTEEDLKRQLEKVQEQRTLSLLKDLQEAGLRIRKIRSRILAVSQKLRYTGQLRSVRRGDAAQPEFSIFRKGADKPIDSDEDGILEPGDVIEVVQPTPFDKDPTDRPDDDAGGSKD